MTKFIIIKHSTICALSLFKLGKPNTLHQHTFAILWSSFICAFSYEHISDKNKKESLHWQFELFLSWKKLCNSNYYENRIPIAISSELQENLWRGTLKGILNSALNHFAWICIPAANTDHQTQYIVKYLFIEIYWKWYFNKHPYFKHSLHGFHYCASICEFWV